MVNVKYILEKDLKDNIIPFWNSLVDEEYGGFYGACDLEFNVIKEAPKGLVFTSRLLYSYSSLYLKYKNEDYLNKAKVAYQFLIEKLYDEKYGCFYWSCTHDGKPLNDHKHLYGNSFALYGLANYYLACKDKEVLKYCREVFGLIKKNLKNFPYDYHEEYSRDFIPLENKVMEGYGMVPDITTNTLLHLAESVALYYHSYETLEAQEIVFKILDIMFTKGYDSSNYNFYQFLNRDLESVIDVYSYGHNIEISWLFMDIMKMSNITNRKYFVELVHIFEKNFQESYIDGYVINQKVNEEVDKSAIWWIQAESLSALKNINEIYPKEEYYLAIMSITEFIARNFMNPKKEWNWGIDENGIIQQEHSICEMWKANYHNVRAVLKILEESDGE